MAVIGAPHPEAVALNRVLNRVMNRVMNRVLNPGAARGERRAGGRLLARVSFPVSSFPDSSFPVSSFPVSAIHRGRRELSRGPQERYLRQIPQFVEAAHEASYIYPTEAPFWGSAGSPVADDASGVCCMMRRA